MPVQEKQVESQMLLNREFHLAFAREFGFAGWQNFVRGLGVPVKPQMPGIFKPFLHAVSTKAGEPEVLIQEIIDWTIPNGWTAPIIRNFDTPIMLESGDTIKEFIDTFSGLFGKHERKAFEDAASGELDYDYGYDSFPGIKYYEDEAIKMLNKYLNHYMPKHADWFSIMLRLGYRGGHTARGLLEYLLEDEVEDTTKEEDKRRVDFKDALESGLRDSYAAAARDALQNQYITAITGHPFNNSTLTFGDGSWEAWTLTLSFGELVDYSISNMRNHDDPFYYSEHDEDSYRDFYYDSDSIAQSDNSPDVGDLDISYGVDYFADRVREANIFQEGAR